MNFPAVTAVVIFYVSRYCQLTPLAWLPLGVYMFVGTYAVLVSITTVVKHQTSQEKTSHCLK